jgi:hypothetical protein
MSNDKCCIPDDLFAIISRYLENDCKSITRLIKTKKTFRDIIGSEINIEEKKQNYIDVSNCFKLYNYIKKLSTYVFKLELMAYDLNLELVLDNNITYDNYEIRDKLRLYESKKNKNIQKIEDIVVFVKNERCIPYMEEYIRNSYYEVNYNHMSYIYGRISLMSAQKLYDIILNIDMNHIFSNNDDDLHVLCWITEINDYDSENHTYQDYNY